VSPPPTVSTSESDLDGLGGLGGLGGLDFGAPVASMPMGTPGGMLGSSSMDALNPMNMGAANMKSTSTGSQGSKSNRRNSPRSQALNGFLDGF
jgi:hypothetical protein